MTLSEVRQFGTYFFNWNNVWTEKGFKNFFSPNVNFKNAMGSCIYDVHKNDQFCNLPHLICKNEL